MTILKTNYLGLELKNPLVASASPLSENVEDVKKLERAGVSAVVMYSLFEEQITKESLALDHYMEQGTETYAEALSYFPQFGRYSIGAETYLDHLRALKNSIDIPVIASLNGASRGKWIEYAERIEASGADALELNVYYLPTDPDESSQSVEEHYLDLIQNVCMAVEIPVAIKLSPFFTSIPNFTKKVADTGAKGVVLFNRFYQPDFDLDKLEVVPSLKLSNNSEMLLPLRWIAIMYGKIDIDFALTTGVQTGADILKAMMAGSKVTMVASEFLRKGINRASEMLESAQLWMEDHEYKSIEQMQGSMSQKAVGDPATFERANYMKVLSSYRLPD
ncbi:MAG: dihydroorotate dehydrogenase-like protein [Aliifodinibius sp.]|nr:dihydroorotate dehydrogenase-like protein [Fodinibius sp.]